MPQPDYDAADRNAKPDADDRSVQSLLGALLRGVEAAQQREPDRLGALLASDVVRQDLRQLAKGLDAGPMLRLLASLAGSGLPDEREIIDSLIAPGPGDAEPGRYDTLRTLHGAAVVGRAFQRQRIEALRHACRGIAEEIS